MREGVWGRQGGIWILLRSRRVHHHVLSGRERRSRENGVCGRVWFGGGVRILLRSGRVHHRDKREGGRSGGFERERFQMLLRGRRVHHHVWSRRERWSRWGRDRREEREQGILQYPYDKLGLSQAGGENGDILPGASEVDL